MDWLAENVWLSYSHKPAKTELTILAKLGKLKPKPNSLMHILTKESWHENTFDK